MNIYSWRSPLTAFSGRLTPTVKKIIIINVAIFIVIHLFSRFPWFAVFGLVPYFVFARLMLWQLFTYMFFHGGLWHLVINMLMLLFFGCDIERSWGRKQFLFYYFFTGIGAGLCSYLTSFRSPIPVVGASGAIFGLLVAYAMMFPDTVVFLFLFFPMRIRHVVFVLGGINLLGALTNPDAGIAYFAHIGGGLFGYLYLKNEWIRYKFSSYFSLFNFKQRSRQRKIETKQLEDLELEKEIDHILEKISKYGMRRLSRKERKILEKARS